MFTGNRKYRHFFTTFFTNFFVAFFVAVCMQQPAMAQTKKTAGDSSVAQALRKAQGMLQELSARNTQLEAENKSFQEKIKQLEPKAERLAKVEADFSTQRNSLEKTREQNSEFLGRINRDSERISTLQKTLSQSKEDNVLLVEAIKEHQSWIRQCSEKNQDLLAANKDLLEKYRNKGVWQSLKNDEPVTGFSRVEEENIVQDFNLKLKLLKVTPWEEKSLKEITQKEEKSVSENKENP